MRVHQHWSGYCWWMYTLGTSTIECCWQYPRSCRKCVLCITCAHKQCTLLDCAMHSHSRSIFMCSRVLHQTEYSTLQLRHMCQGASSIKMLHTSNDSMAPSWHRHGEPFDMHTCIHVWLSIYQQCHGIYCISIFFTWLGLSKWLW